MVDVINKVVLSVQYAKCCDSCFFTGNVTALNSSLLPAFFESLSAINNPMNTNVPVPTSGPTPLPAEAIPYSWGWIVGVIGGAILALFLLVCILVTVLVTVKRRR